MKPPADQPLDVVAIVHKVNDLSEILTKQGKQLSKRELTLADRTGYTCQLTIWGKQAEQWDHNDNPVVSCKGLKLSDYGGTYLLAAFIATLLTTPGRTLSASGSTTMHINPDTPDAHNLRGWYESEGRNLDFKNFSSGGGGGASMRNTTLNRDDIKTLQEVRDSDLGTRDTADYFTARATIISIKHENIAYPACKSDSCNKKVVDAGNGYHCEKCDKTWDQPEYRYVYCTSLCVKSHKHCSYLLSMQVSDHTTQAWLQAFNDVGAEIIGMSADDLMKIKASFHYSDMFLKGSFLIRMRTSRHS